jgi:hypothetical protein
VFEAVCKDKLAPLVLRLALGLFCVSHGYLKIMSAGGTKWYPEIPVGWQLAIAWGEFASGLAVLVGFRCPGTLAWWQGWNLVRLPLRSLEPTLLVLLTGSALLLLGGGDLSVDGRSLGRLTASGGARKR